MRVSIGTITPNQALHRTLDSAGELGAFGLTRRLTVAGNTRKPLRVGPAYALRGAGERTRGIDDGSEHRS
jgi:hypothetical protein